MKRRRFLTLVAAAAVAAAPVFAEDMVAGIIRQLEDQGFDTVTTERTLLGRVRIMAVSQDGLREIILNPRSGEILRDLWTASAHSTHGAKIISGGKGPEDPGDDRDGHDNGGGGGGDDDGDHNSDDDDDDDD